MPTRSDISSRPSHLKRPSVVVAGSGRSGTTWLATAFSECRRAVPLFEPLNRDRVPSVPVAADFPAFPGIYLPAGEEHPVWRDYFRQVLDGQIRNRWTRQDWKCDPLPDVRWGLAKRLSGRWAKTRYDLRAARRRLLVVKIIRGNLLLGWLAATFPVRGLVVVRHPCAVVASRLRHGWPSDLSGIDRQPKLMRDLPAGYSDMIRRAGGEVDRMTVLWCLENRAALAAAAAQRLSVVSYEWIAAGKNDDRCLERFGELSRQFGLVETGRSRQAVLRWHSSPAGRDGRRAPWHAGLGERRGRQVLDLCRQFGLQMYGEDSLRCELDHSPSPLRGNALNGPTGAPLITRGVVG